MSLCQDHTEQLIPTVTNVDSTTLFCGNASLNGIYEQFQNKGFERQTHNTDVVKE
jgi:hypothetical protein